MLRSTAWLLAVLTLPAAAAGVPLQEATITRTINDVRVINPRAGTSPARIAQVIKDDMGVKTGIKSRAELLFQDNTLTRLGAESYFTFRPGTREMSLDQGTLLLQVPKDHGGATIRSASVTASITGTTVMIENLPKKSVKLVVLEGSMRISLGNRFGETLSLGAGKMLIVQAGANKLPAPVSVDLRRLIKTSSLVNPDLFATTANNKPPVLPSISLIETAIAKQDMQKKDGTLQETNLVIFGKGTTVVAADSTLLAAIDKVGTQSPVSPIADVVAPSSDSATTPSNASALAGSADIGSIISDAATANNAERGTTSNTSNISGNSNSSATASLAQTTARSVIALDGAAATAATAAGNGGSITLIGDQIVFGNSSITAANLSGGEGFTGGTVTQAAGDGGTLNAGTTGSPITNNVEVQIPITATSGRSATGGIEGAGGTFSAVANGLIHVNGSIVVSGDSAHPDTTLPTAALDRKSASGGVIRLTSLLTSGNGIVISNSSQLVAVLNSAAAGPGGRIEFSSAGAAINVAGTLRADGGTIDIRNNGAGGNIAFNQADLSANVIKAGTIGGDGTINIQNSTLSASNLLYLYAPGANGKIRFQDNTTLTGPALKFIAANQVSVDNGKVVIVGGPAATVFTNVPNYSTFNGGNGTTTGRFQSALAPAVPGATTAPFATRPGF